MLRAGDQFISGRSGGVASAFYPYRGGCLGVAPAHIFRYSGTEELRIGPHRSRVVHYCSDADMAFFLVLGKCEPTRFARPRLGEAELINSARRMGCRITDASWSIAYVVLQPGNLPGPGDSGTPVFQDGAVVGMLIAINLGTCRGTVITGEFMHSKLSEYARSAPRI